MTGDRRDNCRGHIIFKKSSYNTIAEQMRAFAIASMSANVCFFHNIVYCSMDGKSRWADNVMIERWFRSLKTEKIYINEFRSPKELRKDIREYITEYNSVRPHEAHKYATPDEIYNGSFATEEKDAA